MCTADMFVARISVARICSATISSAFTQLATRTSDVDEVVSILVRVISILVAEVSILVVFCPLLKVGPVCSLLEVGPEVGCRNDSGKRSGWAVSCSIGSSFGSWDDGREGRGGEGER